jgi:hypothetical protein
MIVIAKRVAAAPLRKGEFEFACEDVEGAEAIVGMAARCPCGCGAEAFLDFSAAAEPRFTWDGDEEKPGLGEVVVFPGCAAASLWRLARGAWIGFETK